MILLLHELLGVVAQDICADEFFLHVADLTIQLPCNILSYRGVPFNILIPQDITKLTANLIQSLKARFESLIRRSAILANPSHHTTILDRLLYALIRP